MSKRLSRLLPPVIIVLFVVGYLLTAYLTLDFTTRRVPVLTAFVTLVLLAIDIFNDLIPESRRSDSVEGGSRSFLGREITAVLFVAGGVAGIYLVGFLAAIPLYLFASIKYLGAQTTRVAIIVALIASVSIYLIFELALAYRLFPGILFS
jgi:hypothetical protein